MRDQVLQLQLRLLPLLLAPSLSGCDLVLPQEPLRSAEATPTALHVAPRAPVLEPGAALQFSAELQDGSGAAVSEPLSWQATGGTISGDGVYVAGPAAGEFLVVAKYRGILADTAIVTVTVAGGDAPSASLTYGCSDLTCRFDGSASIAANGVLVAYDWQFGDGSSASGVTAQHTFAQAGTYTVGLTVRNDRGGSASAARTVEPTAAAPSTWIYPGDDIQAAVNNHPAGTEFLIKAGTHRLQTVVPKAGNAFVGEPGAVLSGARVLSAFVREGSHWVVAGQTQENPTYGPNVWGDEVCADGRKGCVYPEDLFFDDVPLVQVTRRGDVASGAWYFDYAADKIYFADDPHGHVVEIGVAEYAFRGDRTHGLRVQGLVIEKYANAGQTSALEAFNADDVVFADNEVRFNHGKGLAITGGARGRISGNYVHHQGQLGVAAYGTTGLVIGENEIAYNGHAGYSMFWEAGGSKFVRTQGLVVRGNHAHHNRGNGLWTDIDNVGTLYEDNLAVANVRIGIYHEISYDAVIRNNTVLNNGEGGITVAHSPNVEVYGNTVSDNANGILGVQRDRGSGNRGPYEIRNLYVHDNVITMSHGYTGLLQFVRDDSYFTNRNNRFDDNTYVLGTNTAYFAWRDGWRTVPEWQAYGHDVNGTFRSR